MAAVARQQKQWVEPNSEFKGCRMDADNLALLTESIDQKVEDDLLALLEPLGRTGT